MTERPKLTIKKPLSTEKQSQLSQGLQYLVPDVPKKFSVKEQEHLMHEAHKRRREGIKTALEWLQQTYPQCFSSQDPKPLKLKVEADLFAELPSNLNLSKVKIRQALNYHTKSIAYLKSMIHNTHRYDLQGHAVEEIYTAYKIWAQERLEKVKTLKQQKKELLIKLNP